MQNSKVGYKVKKLPIWLGTYRAVDEEGSQYDNSQKQGAGGSNNLQKKYRKIWIENRFVNVIKNYNSVA